MDAPTVMEFWKNLFAAAAVLAVVMLGAALLKLVM
jgi:hypothetical protein